MEDVNRFLRGNYHVPCLNLLDQINVDKLRLFKGVGVSPISEGGFFLLLFQSL